MARRDDFVDECRPVVRPFLLEDGDKNQIELVQQGLLRLDGLFRGGALKDIIHDKVADSCRHQSHIGTDSGGKG